MTKQDVAKLSFKVLSIYALIRAIERLIDILRYNYGNQSDEAVIFNFLIISMPFVALILCSIILWFIAPWLAFTIFKQTESNVKEDVSISEIYMIAYSVIGLYLVASGLPDLMSTVIVYLAPSSSRIGDNYILMRLISVATVKILTGIWLIFGARRIVIYLLRREKREEKNNKEGRP